MDSRLAPPFAAQSDIVLASQKDDFHVNEFRDDLYSFFERVSPTGPQSAFGAKPEIFFGADFLYYFLTKGRQTLGEEYCDVFLFECDGRTRFRKHRLLLTACLALGPYLVQRIELGGWTSLVAALRQQTSPQQQFRMRQQQQQQQQQHSWTSIPKRVQQVVLQLLSIAARVHLAVFYWRGEYLSPILRLFGAKYLFTREPNAPRPTFSVLAYFIAIQLGLELAQRAAAAVWRTGTTQDELASIVPSAQPEQLKPSTSGMFTNNPCGICLSALTAPACPPCGHVYCYECIVESCIAKSECPLCRREATPQSILCIYE